MAFDLPAARARIGLVAGDTTRDAELTLAMNVALARAERFCNRNFTRRREVREFLHFTGDTAQLHRYPLQAVHSIETDGVVAVPTGYHIHNDGGRILFDAWQRCHRLVIDYTGGYNQLPADLELALWLLFDGTLASLNPSAGAAAAAGRVIESETHTVPDVGSHTVRYATGSAAASGMGDSGLSADLEAMLRPFRMEVC